MFKITKRIEVSGAHWLDLPYESPCSNVHGHNWIVDVTIEGENLSPHGMLIDFVHIKQVVNELDHTTLNDVVWVVGNPTAENLCFLLAIRLNAAIVEEWASYKVAHQRSPRVVAISIQENEGNIATWKL